MERKSTKEQIIEVMKEKGMTDAKLGEAIGTSRPNISRVLHGKEVLTKKMAKRMVNALNTSILWYEEELLEPDDDNINN